MKLGFCMTLYRRNSTRVKVMGQKWIYIKIYTFHRQDVVHLRRQETHSSDRVGAISEGERPQKYGVVSFYWLNNTTG